MSKKTNNQDAVHVNRRDLLRIASLTGALGLSGVASSASHEKPPGKLAFDMAGYDYDRVQALMDGQVTIEGCETNFEVGRIGDMNTHVFSSPQTRVVSEIGLGPFILAYANDGFRDYTLLPIFPLRVFRHKNIFIRTDRGIDKPQDLRGRKIATPGYSSTSLTWIRGIMQGEYGVAPEDVQWVVSAKDSAAKATGGASRFENILPKGLSVTKGPAGMDESDLLEAGEVDALFHAAEPRAFIEGHPKIGRLFADSRATEQAYFKTTGIFPIMHAVAMKTDVLEENPWLAEAVFDAYSSAKQLTYDYLVKSAWYKTSLPWVQQELEDTRALMGENYWSYGIEPNRDALNALFRYSYEQGLAERQLEIEELFHPSGLKLTESSG
jgi:4,5-dihydroxyphthalate decarboxylase